MQVSYVGDLGMRDVISAYTTIIKASHTKTQLHFRSGNRYFYQKASLYSK